MPESQPSAAPKRWWAIQLWSPDRLPAKVAISTLHDHLRHHDFRIDSNNLIAGGPSGYDIDAAAQLVIDNVLSLL